MTTEIEEYGTLILTEDEIKSFDEVDTEVEKAIVSGSPLALFDYGNSLRRSQSVKGVSLAKLLYKMMKSWDIFVAGGIDDTFQNVVCSEMGIPPDSANKYVKMWEAIFENDAIDEPTKKLLLGKPISQLLLLTASARDGSLNPEEMHSAALIATKNELRDLIKSKRGENTSSSSAVHILYYATDTRHNPKGTFVARKGDEYDVLGTLTAKTEWGEKAIRRLVQSSGSSERFE